MDSGALTVSHYRIVQKLRSGGFGDVYLAEDQVLPRVVALKVLPRERSGDEIAQQRFMREARAASALSHPHIARIYEAGEAEGQMFIAMESVDGEPLDALIARGPLTTAEIVRIGLQLVSAVEEAHAHGVIHRDLKPSNVMLTARGDVKVLDFGLAKFHDPAPSAEDATAWKSDSGLVMGTVPYMSPEQALGKAADPRSDIFSIGVVLYQLVTGRLPFAGATQAETLLRITSAQPEPMARFNYELPLELERIIRKCLEKEPERRYQTAAELLVDLRNLDRDRQLDPRRRAGGMRRGGLALLALLLVLAATAAVVVWRRSARPPPVRSMAVLPFDGDFGETIAEMVIGDLARRRELRVMARSTSFRRSSAESPVAAGKALKVDAVLTGKVDTSGDRIIVSTELVDVRDGSRIAGLRRELVREDIATLVSLIGNDVAQSLQLDPRPVRQPPVKAEAYRLYLQGRQQWNTRTPEGLRAAMDRYRRAIEIEPGFAPAYSGLADTYSLLELYASVPSSEGRARAIWAAERAVELDPLLPEAHASLGTVRTIFQWDWQEAEREFRTGIRLSPSDVRGHHWLGLLLGTLGRYDESLAELAIARELDPRSAEVVGSEGYIRRLRGDYARSIEDLRASLVMKPNLTPVRLDLAISLMMAGDYAAALRELENVPGSDDMTATIRALTGDAERARRYLRGAEARPDAAQIGAGIAAVHLALGDRASALRWLHAAADVRSWPVTQAAREPYYAQLYGDPEFDRLLRRLGLTQTRR